MIEWLVDHVNVIYVLLALVFLGCGLLFRQTKRVRELLAMAIIVAIGLLVWYLCGLVMTDRKQLKLNMHDLAQAVLDGNEQKMIPFLANLKYGGKTREQMAHEVVDRVKFYGITSFYISSFDYQSVTRDQDKGRAEVTFLLRVDRGDEKHMLRCWGVFVIEGGKWRLHSFFHSNPVVDAESKTPAYVPD